MADNKNIKSAKRAYDLFCGMLDDRNWTYKQDDKELSIEIYVNGDDIPMMFLVEIDVDRQLVTIHSPVPAKFEGQQVIEGAIATGQINYKLADGRFIFDVNEGRAMLKLTYCFSDSVFSKDTMGYMLECAMYTVDRYNDKLALLAAGKMSLKDFFDFLEE